MGMFHKRFNVFSLIVCLVISNCLIVRPVAHVNLRKSSFPASEKTDSRNIRSKRATVTWTAEGVSESEYKCDSYEVKLCVSFIRLNDSYELKSSLVTVWDICDGLESCEDGYDESTDAAK